MVANTFLECGVDLRHRTWKFKDDPTYSDIQIEHKFTDIYSDTNADLIITVITVESISFHQVGSMIPH